MWTAALLLLGLTASLTSAGNVSTVVAARRNCVHDDGVGAVASCFGFNTTDSTSSLQLAALSSGASQLTIGVPPAGLPLIVAPLFMNHSSSHDMVVVMQPPRHAGSRCWDKRSFKSDDVDHNEGVVRVKCSNLDDCGPDIQAAFDSKSHTVIIPSTGQPWNTGQLILRSNQRVIMEPGVVLIAKRDGFHCVARHGSQGAIVLECDSMLTSVDPQNMSAHPRLSNFSLVGYGAQLLMRQADYNDPTRYNKSEDRMGITLNDVRDVSIVGLTVAQTGGDGIIVTGYSPGSANVYLADLVLDHNYRNALSVISVENMTVERVVLSNTGAQYGTRPMDGVDFEPDHDYQVIANVTMRDVVIENNLAIGISVCLGHFNASTKPVGIVFDNVTVRNNSRGLRHIAGGNASGAGGVGPAVGGFVTINNSLFDGARLETFIIEGATETNAAVSILNTAISHAPMLTEVVPDDDYPECRRWTQAWCALDTRCRWVAKAGEPTASCHPGPAMTGNSSVGAIYASGVSGVTPGATRTPHAVSFQNVTIFANGPSGSGLASGRFLVKTDISGSGQAQWAGDLTIVVEKLAECSGAVIGSHPALKTACRAKADELMDLSSPAGNVTISNVSSI